MATTLLEMQQAWRDYVQNTMVVTVTSTGVPSGQSDFNPGEKVKFDLMSSMELRQPASRFMTSGCT
jgi:hypothetical protein